MSGQQQGPYWLATETNGEHHVRGRNGQTLFIYRADQISLANVHAKRLQDEWGKGDRLLKASAHDLLEALQEAVEALSIEPDDLPCHEYAAIQGDALQRAKAAIAKATSA